MLARDSSVRSDLSQDSPLISIIMENPPIKGEGATFVPLSLENV
jgi:hypothetical protein